MSEEEIIALLARGKVTVEWDRDDLVGDVDMGERMLGTVVLYSSVPKEDRDFVFAETRLFLAAMVKNALAGVPNPAAVRELIEAAKKLLPPLADDLGITRALAALNRKEDKPQCDHKPLDWTERGTWKCSRCGAEFTEGMKEIPKEDKP